MTGSGGERKNQLVQLRDCLEMMPGVSSQVKSVDDALKCPSFKKKPTHAAVTLSPLSARMHRATCCNRIAAAA